MILTYDQLREQVGGRTPADVAVRLRRLGVKYLTGKQGRPFTTEIALNAAMGITSSDSEPDHTPVVEIK